MFNMYLQKKTCSTFTLPLGGSCVQSPCANYMHNTRQPLGVSLCMKMPRFMTYKTLKTYAVALLAFRRN